MATINNGSSVTIQTTGQGSYQVVSPHNTTFTVLFTPSNQEAAPSTSGGGRNYGPLATTKTFGPYGIPGIITITVTGGSAVTYTGVSGEGVISNIDANGNTQAFYGDIKLTPPTYVGLVSNTCVNNTALNNTRYTQNRLQCLAYDDITRLKVIDYNGSLNTPNSFSVTVTRVVEYPIGTLNVFKYSGNNSGTFSGGFYETDWLPIKIPKGAKYYVSQSCDYGSTSASSYYTTYAVQYFGTSPMDSNEFFNWSNSPIANDITTNPTTGTQVGTGGGRAFSSPFAIVSDTSRPSFLIAGDSKQGVGASYDIQPTFQSAVGECARWINKNFASINCGAVGEQMQNVAASAFTVRLNARNYVSNVISNYGINDFLNSRTSVQVIADMKTFRAMFPNKTFHQTTVTPDVTSTDGFQTLSNQTPSAANTERNNFNTALRKNPSYIDGVIDICTAVDPLNLGKWAVTGRVTSADVGITSGQKTLTSASANFSILDVGRVVQVPGAGTAGGYLATWITNYTNSTTVTVNDNAQTTVTTAAALIGAASLDGRHGSQDENRLIEYSNAFDVYFGLKL